MTVEAAIVLPVLFLLVCCLIAGGVGVSRQQQVVCLAREGARWASVRGSQYANETGQPPPTRQQIIDQAVLPMAAGMDPAAVEVRVEWVDKGTNTAWDWDAAAKDLRSATAAGEYVSNAVRVTVRYQWTPGVGGSPMTLQSVCEMPMTN